MLTVCIPVKVPEPYLTAVLKRIEEIRRIEPNLISDVLTCNKGSLAEARLSLAEKAQTEFILNLDADTLIPVDYPYKAVSILIQSPLVGAVALNYSSKPQSHLAFGTSIMRRKLMLEMYDWKSIRESRGCECLYMWRKLMNLGYHIAWSPMNAEHLKHV